ncbi:MAG: Response regulator [Nitrospira sp.]|nr:MAG: Response regulator [Nitrospira sp.]
MIEGKPMVLVVDDDGEMRSLLCDSLWREGYALREAGGGEEAFQLVLSAMPDLVLTEIRFDTGGVDYINRLRAVAPNCPIVVMTAFGDEQVRMKVLRAGATAYFSKPVHLAELKSCVRQLLKGDRGGFQRVTATEAAR